MKKRALILIALLLMGILANLYVQADAGKITFFHWRNEDKPVYDKLVAKFKSETGIDVEQNIVQSDQFQTIYKTHLAANDIADVFAVHPGGEVQMAIDAGAPLDLAGNAALKKLFPSSLLAKANPSSAYKAGRIYAVPQTNNNIAVFYNKDLFQKAGVSVPKTWSQYLSICKKLRAKGIAPIALGGKEHWVPQLIQICTTGNVLETADPDFYDRLGAGKAKLTEKLFVEGLEMVLELGRKGYYQDGFLGTSYDQATMLFAQGMTAMWITGTWSIKAVDSANPKLKWDIFPLPGPKKTLAPSGIGLCLAVNKNSKVKDAAVKFVEFLSRPDNQALLADETGQIPCAAGVKVKDVRISHASEGVDGFGSFLYTEIDPRVNSRVFDAVLYALQEALAGRKTAMDCAQAGQDALEKALKELK